MYTIIIYSFIVIFFYETIGTFNIFQSNKEKISIFSFSENLQISSSLVKIYLTNLIKLMGHPLPEIDLEALFIYYGEII